jgi:hypothetical protein
VPELNVGAARAINNTMKKPAPKAPAKFQAIATCVRGHLSASGSMGNPAEVPRLSGTKISEGELRIAPAIQRAMPKQAISRPSTARRFCRQGFGFHRQTTYWRCQNGQGIGGQVTPVLRAANDRA